MMSLPIEYQRRFSIKMYWASHGLLLLRSHRTLEHPTRLDILFSDVRWMALPVWLDGIRIELGTLSDLPIPLTATIQEEAHFMTVYKVISGGVSHAVMAGERIAAAEDDGLGDQDSRLLPGFKLQGFGLT